MTKKATRLNKGNRFLLRMTMILLRPLFIVHGDQTIMRSMEPMIFSFNHNSSFEALLVPMYLINQRNGFIISFISDWVYQYIPIVGWIIKRVNPIFVYNKPSNITFLNRFKKSRQNAYEQCVERLSKNISIGIFPEGTRNKNPEYLKKARKGIGRIILNSGVPVLPIGIDFPSRLKQGKIPKFGKIIIRIGQKLTFAQELNQYAMINKDNGLSEYEKKRMISYLESTIRHRIMEQIAVLSGKMYPFQATKNTTKIQFSLT